MNEHIKQQLITRSLEIIKERKNDPSHDGNHALQVLKNVQTIAEKEGGDLDILIPAALLHDAVIYAKNDPRSDNAPQESAELTKTVLESLEGYPAEKIPAVMSVIAGCSFHKTAVPETLEGKILCDADKLEATGATAIMRTFSSGGQMGRPLYHQSDPFAEKRTPNAMEHSLDLFSERLLVAKDRLHTQTAKEIATQRTEVLHDFLDQLKRELV